MFWWDFSIWVFTSFSFEFILLVKWLINVVWVLFVDLFSYYWKCTSVFFFFCLFLRETSLLSQIVYYSCLYYLWFLLCYRFLIVCRFYLWFFILTTFYWNYWKFPSLNRSHSKLHDLIINFRTYQKEDNCYLDLCFCFDIWSKATITKIWYSFIIPTMDLGH